MIKTRTTPRYLLRRFMVLAVFVLALAGLLWRALDMQVLNQSFFQREGDARHLRTVTIPAHRGDIYDRNGEPLAISTPVDTVWANPGDVLESGVSLKPLAALLRVDAASLKKRLQRNQQRTFLYLQRHVEPELAEKFRALTIPGIYLQREYRRYYPAGEVTAHVLGFTNVDDIGQEGMELALDDAITGREGSKRIIRDSLGRAVDDVERIRAAEPGKNIYLSIDRRLQYLAYRSLKSAVMSNNAIAGTAVVLDAHTGEILAMVNQPSFNTNDRSQLRPGVTRNRAITDVFEPGSTLKPFTMAAALESGKWHAGDRVDTTPGQYAIQGKIIRDAHNYGSLDMANIIIKSSNVGISKVAMSLNAQQQIDMYARVGFGVDSASGFPGERSGALKTGKVRDFERATMAFGYSISVTALQLARAYSAFATDGEIYPVTLLKRETAVTGERVMSAKTARQVRSMMEKVVSLEGTARDAHVPSYRVAGKTGTVHKFIAGGYAEDRYLSVFAGVAPASDPRLVMVVMVDEPRGKKYFGGQVAGPVFGAVMGDAMRLLDITPDDIKLVAQNAPGGKA
ncbi:MAG TPA: penicillin-binding protein 2 [Gammaproteobacteria bacterium]|nr:penicillin-binding protein 2 [Gammaproteobacteria bacterium]